MPQAAAKLIPMPQPIAVAATGNPITQERLRLGVELLQREWSAIQARQAYLRELMADLAAGGAVEAGELDLNLASGMILPKQEPKLAPVFAMKPVLATKG